MRNNIFKVITNNPVAYTSPDHTHPDGVINGNPGNQEFNKRLYKLFDKKQIGVIDFGCAGGSFVRYCVEVGEKENYFQIADYIIKIKTLLIGGMVNLRK